MLGVSHYTRIGFRWLGDYDPTLDPLFLLSLKEDKKISVASTIFLKHFYNNHKWLVIIGSNLIWTYNWNCFFVPLVTIGNNLLRSICCKYIVDITFFFFMFCLFQLWCFLENELFSKKTLSGAVFFAKSRAFGSLTLLGLDLFWGGQLGTQQWTA